jgi:transposase
MKPISNEKRELIIEAKERGETEKTIAKWLKISERSVTAIWRLYRETGSYMPTPYPGRKPILTAIKWEEVITLVKNEPDKTLEEIIEELSLPIRKSRLSLLLIEAGYSFKKRQFIPQSKTAKMSKKSAKSSPKQ